MTDDDEVARLRRELTALEAENQELDQQVKLLVRTEHRLTRAQSEADRQLARVRALSSFALAFSTAEQPLAIALRAARLLAEWFAVDRVAIVEAVGDDAAVHLVDGDRLPAPRALVDALRGAPTPFVEQLSALPWATALVGATDGLPLPDAGVVAGVPLGNRVIAGLLCWRRPNPRASFFSEPPSPHHLPFLALLGRHLEHALDNASLTRDLRTRTHELADGNDRLQKSLASVEAAHRRLAQASKLEAIGRLAGGVAHDFNNLLTVILTHAVLVRDDLPGEATSREDLELIVDASNRARDITQQLLLFSRKQDNQPSLLRLDVAVDRFSRMARRLIGTHIDLKISHDLRAGMVRIDRNQLDQMLMNLATNARDAMEGGGTLAIETRPATPQEVARMGTPRSPSKGWVALSLSDSGAGMDEATMAHIFDPFYTTKDAGRGTGLGLAIVHGVCEQAGGHVLVDSRLGEGTRFLVLLPEAEGAAERSAPESARATVLVAEDEAAIRHSLRRILSRAGFHVLEARDGFDALAVAREGPRIDLLVTDVVMPSCSGLELAAKLRETRPTLPIVFMSGHTFDTLRQSEIGERERFLQKPFTPAQLLDVVEAVLQES